MNKVISIFILLLLSSSLANAQGMATFDVFNWIQNQLSAAEESLHTAQQDAANAQQLQMIKNQILQLEALRAQIVGMENQYNAMTGTTGYGKYLSGPFTALDPEQTPQTWQEVVWWTDTIKDRPQGKNSNQTPQNQYAGQVRAYADQNPYVKPTGIEPGYPNHPSHHDLESQRTGSLAQGVYSQATYKESLQRYQNIEALQAEIDRADTAKKTADLSARLLSELGKVGAEQLRVASMNTQMEALDRKKAYNEEMADKKFLQYKPKNLMEK